MDGEHRPKHGFQIQPHSGNVPLACSVCRRKKIRCSGELPACFACVRSGSECVYQRRDGSIWPKAYLAAGQDISMTGTSDEGAGAARSRPPDRSQTTADGYSMHRILAACAACRRKKIRCPGERPACVTCLRSGMTCVYESRKYNGTRPIIAPQLLTHGFTPLTFEAPQTAALQQRNKEFERWRQRQRLRACARCRSRKIRCDASKPCGFCQKAGVECVEFESGPTMNEEAAIATMDQSEPATAVVKHDDHKERIPTSISFTPANVPRSNNSAYQKPLNLVPRRTHADFTPRNDTAVTLGKMKQSASKKSIFDALGNARVCYGHQNRLDNGSGETPGYRKFEESKEGNRSLEACNEAQKRQGDFGDFLSQLQRAATSQ